MSKNSSVGKCGRRVELTLMSNIGIGLAPQTRPLEGTSQLVSTKFRLLRNLCLTLEGIWRERADAKRGGAGEGHRRAMRATVGLYTEWRFERLRLVIGNDGRDWDIVEWHD